MKTFMPCGGVNVYKATCGLFVAVTWPGASTVITLEALFVESFRLVATTSTLVLWVTGGAVKIPVGDTVAPELPLTDHMTSESPAESVAASWVDCVAKSTTFERVTESWTGSGGGSVAELQPVEKRIKVINTTVPSGFRFINYPKREMPDCAGSL